MKKLLIFMVLLHVAAAYSQRQNDNWYFSLTAGLNFSSGEPIALLNNQIWTREGTATVSNAQGNLLFYTNGAVVYNSNHEIMDNGDGLTGSYSSTQTVVVQKPGSGNIYYIFTTGSSDEPNIMGYSEVDMNLNGGLGGITGNKNVMLLSSSMENLTSTFHNNGRDIWILTNDKNGLFTAFLVTDSGVSNVPVTSPGFAYNATTLFSEIGLFKVSPDGSKLAAIHSPEGLFVYNFNNTTGVLGDLLLSKPDINLWYGLEFSPSGRFVYFSKDARAIIVQYDLEATNIAASLVEIMNVSFLLGGGLQIGPNGKIYCTHLDFNKLSVINNPDAPGLSANVQVQAVDLGIKRAFLGLPSLFLIPVDLQIISEDICQGQNVPFAFTSSLAFDSVTWDFGDGTTSTETNPNHLYTGAGTYTVTLTGHRPGMNRVAQALVIVAPRPDAGLDTQYQLCAGSTLFLSAPSINGTFEWSTGSNETIVEITKGGSYSLNLIPDNGCETSFSFTVTEVDCTAIPKGISPNGDGMNDNFNLAHMNIQNMAIFNRYGLEVYSLNNYVSEWHGQSKDGKELPDGTYYYFIENAMKTYTGWVYINRQVK